MEFCKVIMVATAINEPTCTLLLFYNVNQTPSV